MTISSFDLIISNFYKKNPYILVFDKSSILIFKDVIIFQYLLKLLSNPIFNTDLADSIHAALEIKKMKKYERESYLFVLIDGLSHKRQEEDIKYYSNQCQLIGMRVFGIGLGIYPYKMKEFFDTFIYSINPGNLLKGLSKIFGELIKTEIELKMVCEKKKLDKKN